MEQALAESQAGARSPAASGKAGAPLTSSERQTTAGQRERVVLVMLRVARSHESAAACEEGLTWHSDACVITAETRPACCGQARANQQAYMLKFWGAHWHELVGTCQLQPPVAMHGPPQTQHLGGGAGLFTLSARSAPLLCALAAAPCDGAARASSSASASSATSPRIILAAR